MGASAPISGDFAATRLMQGANGHTIATTHRRFFGRPAHADTVTWERTDYQFHRSALRELSESVHFAMSSSLRGYYAFTSRPRLRWRSLSACFGHRLPLSIITPLVKSHSHCLLIEASRMMSMSQRRPLRLSQPHVRPLALATGSAADRSLPTHRPAPFRSFRARRVTPSGRSFSRAFDADAL
jgi:hypothetical protein